MTVEIINLTSENIAHEGIVCVRGKENQAGIDLKIEWLKQRFSEGFVFKILKVNHRAQGLIEYGPIEKGWRAVEGKNYLLIHCFWVIGSAKGKGYGSRLLAACLEDAKIFDGVAIVTSAKPFLPDKKFFLKKGFKLVDTAPPYFELLIKQNNLSGAIPKFKADFAKKSLPYGEGITFLYSDQCPYIAKYIHEMRSVAEKHRFPVKLISLNTCDEAQHVPCAYGTFNVIYQGKLLTHEIMSAIKFEKLLAKI